MYPLFSTYVVKCFSLILIYITSLSYINRDNFFIKIKKMQISKVCNNIKISQIDWSTIFSTFSVQLNIRNERKGFQNVGKCIFQHWILKNIKGPNCWLCLHNSTSLSHQCFASEAGASPLAKSWIHIRKKDILTFRLKTHSNCTRIWSQKYVSYCGTHD